MTSLYAAWGVSAAVLILFAIIFGVLCRHGFAGILVDNRGRYSLTHLQIVLWSIVVLSLISGVMWGRLLDSKSKNPLDFEIPTELLTVMGISLGSAAAATTIKVQKDLSHPERIAASNDADRPRFAQMLFLEEGDLADQVVDVTKFQNFWLTIVLVVAYVGLAIRTFSSGALGSPGEITTLPVLSGTMVALLGISHAGYVAAKLPNRPGSPQGLTVQLRSVGAVPRSPVPAAGAAGVVPAATYIPRNPG